jgi:hypothetical protein
MRNRHAGDVDLKEDGTRLHVYLARDAPLGVVLRRGPSAWARLSLWHTESDTFDHGQWIRGRVYERRGDLAPDGSLFVAFVRSGVAGLPAQRQADSWIAISRPPYFTALALWWIGGTYCGGGLFPDRRSVWLGSSDWPDQGDLPAWLVRASAIAHLDRSNNWTERTVFHNRLLRDGWTLVTEAGRELWEHRRAGHSESLRFTELGWDPRAFGGPHQVEYALHDGTGGMERLPHVTWADWDQRGRLIVARRGKLLHWQAPDSLIELADFNAQAHESIAAPAWALRWPPEPAAR